MTCSKSKPYYKNLIYFSLAVAVIVAFSAGSVALTDHSTAAISPSSSADVDIDSDLKNESGTIELIVQLESVSSNERNGVSIEEHREQVHHAQEPITAFVESQPGL